MAGKETSYTHHHWRVTLQAMIDGLEQQLLPALDHIKGDWTAVGAGRGQMQFINQVAIGGIKQQATVGKQLLGGHGVRLARVGQAQQAAGGLEEVAARKEYHRR